MRTVRASVFAVCVAFAAVSPSKLWAADLSMVNDPVMQDVEVQIHERQGEMLDVNFRNKVMQEKIMQQNVESNLMQANIQPVMQKQMQEKTLQEMEANETVGQIEIDPRKRQLEMQQKMKQIMQAKIQAGLFADKPPVTEFTRRKGMAAREAAGIASSMIDENFHNNGKLRLVPGEYRTIQKAIDASSSGDVVLVSPGTYYELLVMKDGVKLVSDSSGDGDLPSPVKGAELRLPKRTLRTIIDGSRSNSSEHGMIDFEGGVGRNTIVDGFTIQNLPIQDHHKPGHAHGLNVRGANPVITNCLIRNMGSTGIGSHVVFYDQDKPMVNRDFRWSNIKYQASPVLFKNIIHGSLGLGIGCNHFSTPYILGNEVFGNDDSSLGDPVVSPGIGNKHGSAATIVGNLVHDNPGGGILCKVGEHQGIHPIDRPPHPTFSKNIVYGNGGEKPAISCQGCGTDETPVSITGNYIFNTGSVGIALGRQSVGIIEENLLPEIKNPGITVFDAVALKINRNVMPKRGDTPGIIIKSEGLAREMEGNAIDSNNDYPEIIVKNNSPMKEKGRRKGGPDRMGGYGGHQAGPGHR